MRNRSFNVIDPDTNQEITIWQSRSCATAGFIFAKDYDTNKWYVLANQRGHGTPDYQGYWNCPCGYLDYDEDFTQAIVREVWEETGLVIWSKYFNQYYINSDPYDSNRQNVTVRQYAILDTPVDKLQNFSMEHMEPNEVSDIKWISIDNLDNYQWAFGHKEYIMEVFNKFVDIPWYKKFILKLYKELFE